VHKVIALISSVLILGASAAFACCSWTKGTDPTKGGDFYNQNGNCVCYQYSGGTDQQSLGNQTTGYNFCYAHKAYWYKRVPGTDGEPCDSTHGCVDDTNDPAQVTLARFTGSGTCPSE